MPRADSPEKAVRAITKPRLSEEARGLFAPQRKAATATASMAAPSLFSGSSIRIPRRELERATAADAHSENQARPIIGAPLADDALALAVPVQDVAVPLAAPAALSLDSELAYRVSG